jgi:hypothetical protein
MFVVASVPRVTGYLGVTVLSLLHLLPLRQYPFPVNVLRKVRISLGTDRSGYPTVRDKRSRPPTQLAIPRFPLWPVASESALRFALYTVHTPELTILSKPTL